jgi:hypothetical protein
VRRKKQPPTEEPTRLDRLSNDDLTLALETSLMAVVQHMDGFRREPDRKEAHLAHMERHLTVAVQANQAMRRRIVQRV